VELKTIVNHTPMSHVLRGTREQWRFLRWRLTGRPAPPPHRGKVKVLRGYAQKTGYKTFIETGTCRGDTVFALRNAFKRLITIELSEQLFQDAQRRFVRYKHIEVLQGDSGKVLASVLARINEPCVFWLDAHYSAGITAKGDLDTPVSTEIALIAGHHVRSHVLLIDDARCFDGTNDYPKLNELEASVRELRPDWLFEVANDVIRICSNDA
jgi:hypothetical protein